MAIRRMYVLLPAVLTLGGAVPLLLWAASARRESHLDTLAVRPLPVTVVTARSTDSYEVWREYTGTLAAARSSQMAFERAGKVLKVHVDQGEAVEANQLVAQLDKRHLLAQRKQLEAQLRAAQAQLAERVAGPRIEQIAAADAEVRDLAAQQQLQRLNSERREALLGKNAIAREEYDIARFGLEAVSARLDAARQHLSELQAGVRAEQIAAARAAVDELKAALENLDHDLEDCLLKAPFAGAVAERFVDEGVVITPQTPIVRITENRLLEAWVGLPVKAASQLKVGQVVALRCQGERFEGTVRAVLPDLDATTQTRGVVVALPEHTPLAAGQVARLGVPERVHATCYSLPVTALTGASRGLWSCFAVVNDNDGAARLERRDVEVLHTTGEHAWVRGTLREGDSIVSSGTHRVAQGQLVHVVPADDERQDIAFSRRDCGPCN